MVNQAIWGQFPTAAAREAIAQPDRYAAILMAAFPDRMREPMPEDLWALADFLDDGDERWAA